MRAAILGVVIALAAGVAVAFVPTSGKIAFQVAKRNRAEGRAHPFELAVTLRDAAGDVVGQGTLLTDPRGLARLEFEGADGRTQRHLARGGEYQVAVDGRLVGAPEPWLPPLFFLQAGSGDVLMSALLSLGAAPEETVLGRIGDAVCYVVGGRDLAPPANASAAQMGSPGPKAAIWVEREGFEVVRIDRLDGTRYVLGPLREHDGARLPEWVRIERPAAPPARLEILSARRARPDLARDFGMEWLLSP